MLTHFLRFICPFLSIVICGHFSREELDAASLASTVINVLGLCIDMGFSTASETLFSQTYGSSRRKLMGIILQRESNSHGIAYFRLASEYILFFLPGLYCDFLFMTLSRYLTSQNLVRPMMIAACAGTIFTTLTQPAVYRLGLGLRWALAHAVPLGICTAVNVRVGQGLGAFDPQRAQHTYMTALFSVFGIVVTTAVPVVLLRHKIPYLFTTDREVIEEAVKLFPMLLIFQFCEGLGGVSEAVLLACGRQFLGSVTIFLGYYVVGLPLGLLLTYKFEIGIIGKLFRALCNVRQNSEGITNVFKEPDNIAKWLRVHLCFVLSETLLHDPIRSRFVPTNLEMSIEENQPPLTTHQSDYTNIRFRVAIFVIILIFLFCNLWYRFFHTTPYWMVVCQNQTGKKPSGEFCKNPPSHLTWPL
ncbi:unnamed protein product [Hydatigera taeniaeformis]|uniref:Solute carrier family 10 member 2 n=1 Tax=Hydatigena taeniaeformis TaxID=6205 RepID=A0A158RF23_HYDTA|nr:unnamed protein product [Hydatigera taeniaeformis]